MIDWAVRKLGLGFFNSPVSGIGNNTEKAARECAATWF
jgi:hypothetical protein